MELLISDELFDAYLRCKTKAYLTFGQAGMAEPLHPIGNWQRQLAEDYQADCRDRLRSANCGDCFVGNPRSEDLRSAKHRLIIQPHITAQDVGSNIHALERLLAPTEKR